MKQGLLDLCVFFILIALPSLAFAEWYTMDEFHDACMLSQLSPATRIEQNNHRGIRIKVSDVKENDKVVEVTIARVEFGDSATYYSSMERCKKAFHEKQRANREK